MGCHHSQYNKTRDLQSINNLLPIKKQLNGKHPSEITQLDLYKKKIKTEVLFVMKNYSWNNLQILSLSGNLIGDKGCKAISGLSMKQIQTILLWNNNITSGGISHLSKANWDNLLKLWIDHNFITKNGVRYLTKFNSKKLKQISLWNNEISLDEIIQLCLIDGPHLNQAYLRLNYRKLQPQNIQNILRLKFQSLTIRFEEDYQKTSLCH